MDVQAQTDSESSLPSRRVAVAQCMPRLVGLPDRRKVTWLRRGRGGGPSGYIRLMFLVHTTRSSVRHTLDHVGRSPPRIVPRCVLSLFSSVRRHHRSLIEQSTALGPHSEERRAFASSRHEQQPSDAIRDRTKTPWVVDWEFPDRILAWGQDNDG